MKNRSSRIPSGRLAILAISLAGLAFFAGPSRAVQDPVDGVEVLTRGPVHEAFAEPYAVNPRAAPIVPKKPPEAIEELPPDQRPEGDNVLWIPGYFAWDDETADFLWISGSWRQTPPNRQWIPGHWSEADNGWQWAAGYWVSAGETEAEYLPPPPRSLEAGPSVEAPNADNIYVPGCWVWQTSRYLWRPGFWMVARPNWVYVPAHYQWCQAGCLFVEGYWDYPLVRRGLLFAPVRLTSAYWDRPVEFRPQFVIQSDFLLDSLFVRTDFRRYYFGDYYAEGYSDHSFVPWFLDRPAKNISNPLFAYYRWEHRGENWAPDLQRTFTARRSGEAPRPPATLVLQEKMIQNLTVNNTIQIGDKVVKVKDSGAMIRSLTAVQPLAKLEQPNFKLQAVPQAQLEEERKFVKQQQTVEKARHQTETRILKQGINVKESAKAKIELPVRTAKTKIELPPTPTIPKQVEREIPKYDPVKPIVLPRNPIPLREGKPPQKKEVTPPIEKKEVKETKPPVEKKEIKPPVDKKETKPPVEKKEIKPPVEKKEIKLPPPDKKEVILPPVEKKEIKPPPPDKKEGVPAPVKINPPPPPKDKKDKGMVRSAVPWNGEDAYRDEGAANASLMTAAHVTLHRIRSSRGSLPGGGRFQS